MKKLLSVLLAMAVLVGFGALAAQALTEEEAEQATLEFALMMAGYEEKVGKRTMELNSTGKQLLGYEISEKTKAAQQAWEQAQRDFKKAQNDYDLALIMGEDCEEPDATASLNAWKKYQAVRLETIQSALTIKVPKEAWKFLGENATKQFFNYVRSWMVRYILFGWAWMPY